MVDWLGLNQRIGDLQRLREIINVLIKHGYGHLLHEWNLHEFLPFGEKLVERLRSSEPEHPGWSRLRAVFEDLGPTFVKFGQIMSLRTDLTPPDLARELESLQDTVEPEPWEDMRPVLEEELGDRLDELDVDPEPVASASLAQVYRATLPGGEEVVLKVQRPEIEKKIDRDLNLLRVLAGAVERYGGQPERFQPVALVEEFGIALREELNFSFEGLNIRTIRQNFSDNDRVCFPRVYWNWTSRRVLATEFIRGRPVADYFLGEDDPPEPREELALHGAECMLEQIFEHGFFHGDPHPGNILITPEGRIGFVDFGVVGRMDQELNAELSRLLTSVVNRDTHELSKVLIRLDILEPDQESLGLRRHLLTIIDRYYNAPLHQISGEEIMNDLHEFLSRHDIRFPPEFYLLVKCVLTVESIGERLDPDFELAEVAEPYLKRLVRRHRGLRPLLSMIPNVAVDTLRFMRDLPHDVSSLIRELKGGRIQFEFEHRGLEKLMNEFRQDTNRISMSLIVAALIIGSSLLIATEQGPMVWGFSLLGLIGFLAAGFFGLWLMVSVLRSGRY